MPEGHSASTAISNDGRHRQPLLARSSGIDCTEPGREGDSNTMRSVAPCLAICTRKRLASQWQCRVTDWPGSTLWGQQ